MRKTITQNPIEISRVLRRIEKKIDILVGGVETKRPTRKREETMATGEGLDIMTLLSFPDHLRKSAMTIMKLGKAMAEDVAKETGRARAIESAYLNQLVRMGYVKKGREGRRVYFSVEGNQASVELLVKENVAIGGG